MSVRSQKSLLQSIQDPRKGDSESARRCGDHGSHSHVPFVLRTEPPIMFEKTYRGYVVLDTKSVTSLRYFDPSAAVVRFVGRVENAKQLDRVVDGRRHIPSLVAIEEGFEIVPNVVAPGWESVV